MFYLYSFIPLSVHYIFYTTISFIAGITLFYFCQFSWYIMAAIICLSIIPLIFPTRSLIKNSLFYCIGAALTIGYLFSVHQKNNYRDFQQTLLNKSFTIQASVSDIEEIQHPHYRCKIRVQLQSFHTDQAFKSSQRLLLYVTRYPSCIIGDLIEIKNLSIKEINNASFVNYLIKEKIVATIFIEDFIWTLIARPSFDFGRFAYLLRKKIYLQLRKKINRETFALFSSVFLGNRTQVKKQMDSKKELFKIWGTSHYLARSGLHLIIFVIVWHFLLCLMPFSYTFKQILLVILVFLYALFSWSSISFERSLLMLYIYRACVLTRTPSHYVHLISLVTLIVLCINPYQLFFLDFQLSFGLTFALAWFNHIEAHKKRALSLKY